jgi:hypothetical protein
MRRANLLRPALLPLQSVRFPCLGDQADRREFTES